MQAFITVASAADADATLAIKIPAPRGDRIDPGAIGIVNGFRHDPMHWVQTGDSLDAALVRRLVFQQERDGDRELLDAHVRDTLAKEDVGGRDLLLLLDLGCTTDTAGFADALDRACHERLIEGSDQDSCGHGKDLWHTDEWAPYLFRSDLQDHLLEFTEQPFLRGTGDLPTVRGIAHDGRNLWALDDKNKRICVIERTESGVSSTSTTNRTSSSSYTRPPLGPASRCPRRVCLDASTCLPWDGCLS